MELFRNIFGEPWAQITAMIGFMLCLFLLTLMFTLLPMIVVKIYRTEQDPDKRTQYSRVIGMLNCFAGGVFLSTALLHLLPNVLQLLNDVKSQAKFPIAEFTVALGFLIVMVVEQTALACKEQEVDTMNPIQRLSQRTLPILDAEIRSLRVDDPQSPVESCSRLPPPVELPPTSHLRSVLLLAVISIHSVFEGLAIGLQTNLDSILNIFVAVIIHKVIVAFSVGLNLLQSRLHPASVLALDILFSCMSPAGLMLGLYVDSFRSSARQQLFSGMLQGIACGTFIYITSFEVLPRELNIGRDRLLKLLTLLIGFSASVGVVFINGS